MKNSPPLYQRYFTVLGLSVLSGMTGGLIFGFRDVLRVLVTRDTLAVRSVAGILSFLSYALFIYVLSGAAMMFIVGLAMAVLMRANRYGFDVPRLLAVYAALFSFIILTMALTGTTGVNIPSNPLPMRMGALFETMFVSIVFAVGMGTLVDKSARDLSDGDSSKPELLLTLVFLCAALASVLVLHGSEGAELLCRDHLRAVGFLLLVVPCFIAGIRPMVGRLFGQKHYSLTRALLFVLAGLTSGGLILLPAGAVPTGDDKLPGRAAPAGATGAAAGDGKQQSKDVTNILSRARPNILWIVLDAARTDVLSCYNSRRRISPNIDRLSRQSTVYERAYAQSNWTLPSHASFFTGLYISDHGASAEYQYLDDKFVTAAEIFRDAGYLTACFSSNGYLDDKYNLTQGFDTRYCTEYGEWDRDWLMAASIKGPFSPVDYGAAHNNQLALGFIRKALRERRPFFLFLNYMEIHNDYGCTPGRFHFIDNHADRARAAAIVQNFGEIMIGKQQLSKREWALLRKMYDGDSYYLDGKIGELINAIGAMGVLDNTLLVIAADHGEEMGDHYEYKGKRKLCVHALCLYDTLLHVPLIVRYPGRFAGGTRSGAIVQLVDILPTMLDVSGIRYDDGCRPLRGLSLLEPREPRNFAISECAIPIAWVGGSAQGYPGYDLQWAHRRLKSVVTGDYKFIWASDGRHELYRISTDPYERHDLYKSMPAKAGELTSFLKEKLGRLKLR